MRKVTWTHLRVWVFFKQNWKAFSSVLQKHYPKELFPNNKYLNVTRKIKKCMLGYYKAAEDVDSCIENLHSSITSVAHFLLSTLDVHFVNWKLKKCCRRCDRKLNCCLCFECKPESCWFTCHASEKGLSALKENKLLHNFVILFDVKF